MKNKKEIVHLLCQISNHLDTKDEQNSVINLAVNLGLIYGQAIQIDVTAAGLKFNDVLFREYGVGVIISNTLYGSKNSLSELNFRAH